METKFITLEKGGTFDFENTLTSERVVKITTAAGSTIVVRLPPGFSVAIPSAMESLKVEHAPGLPPGIGIVENDKHEK